jgi:hypothetical protein
LILLALFVLSTTTPRDWEECARDESLLQTLLRHPPEASKLAPPERPLDGPRLAIREEQTVIVPAVIQVSREFELPPVPAAPAAETRHAVTSDAEVLKAIQALSIVSPIQPKVPSEPVLANPLRDEAPAPQIAAPQFNVATLPKRQVEPPALAPAIDLPLQAPEKPELGWWPVPAELLKQLDRLSEERTVSSWAREAAGLVHELTLLESPDAPRVNVILNRLQGLVENPLASMPGAPPAELQVELIRAQNSLARRVDIWRQVPRISASAVLAARVPATEALAGCIEQISTETANDPAGAAWREYLLLDSLKRLPGHRAQPDNAEKQLARRVLLRLEQVGLSRQQRHFLHSGPLAELRLALHGWIAEPVDGQQMLVQIEEFEKSQLPSDAQLVAGQYQRLNWSRGETDQQLAHLIDTHYRNANVRISVSQTLLNRLMPPQPSKTTRINDTILGNPTQGWGTTDTQLGVRLIPDASRIRFALQARGQTYADTDTSSGPVVVRTHTDATFLAEKEFTVSPAGIADQPVMVEADSVPRLRSIRSGFDFLPVFRSLVHSTVRSRHDEDREKARAEARFKLRRRVGTEMENNLAPRIVQVNSQLQSRVIKPLEEMDLRPEVVAASTTADRLTMRLRLAGDDQLAGHAPRPRAPSDSLASLQIHQSALNNICQQLGWDGRTLTLPEMHEAIIEHLQLEAPTGPSSLPDDLYVTFAPQNAIRVKCQDNRIELNLAIAKLEKSPQKWQDFTVRVFYKPDLSTPGGKLMRDGTVQLLGQRLGPKAQIGLRGIFSKAFPQSRGLQVLPERILNNPRLADLRISQFEIRDGWIGLALTGKATPSQPAADVAQKPTGVEATSRK